MWRHGNRSTFSAPRLFLPSCSLRATAWESSVRKGIPALVPPLAVRRGLQHAMAPSENSDLSGCRLPMIVLVCPGIFVVVPSAHWDFEILS